MAVTARLLVNRQHSERAGLCARELQAVRWGTPEEKGNQEVSVGRRGLSVLASLHRSFIVYRIRIQWGCCGVGGAIEVQAEAIVESVSIAARGDRQRRSQADQSRISKHPFDGPGSHSFGLLSPSL